jgi:hypothetical protein
MSEVPLPPHKFTHPPRGYNWLQKIIIYGIMHPLNGMTSSQRIARISVVPALTWMDTWPFQWEHRIFVSNKTSLPGWKMEQYTRKWYNVGGKLPRDSRSDNQSFLFQSCYGVGCPAAVTYISSAKRHVNIVEGRFISWYEEKVLLRRRNVCVCRTYV